MTARPQASALLGPLTLCLGLGAQDNRVEIPHFLTEAEDGVPAEVRAARSRIFDTHIAFSVLDPPNAPPGAPPAPPMVMHVDLIPQPELPSDTSDAVVIGTVAAMQPFLTFSGRSIYTEYNILISSAVKTPGSASPQVLAVLRRGGTGRLRNGRVIGLHVYGDGDEIQTGGRYLLFLRHHKDANAYSLVKMWRIDMGDILQAAFPDDKSRVSQSQSLVYGRRLEEILKPDTGNRSER